MEGQLPGLGPERPPLCPCDITYIEILEDLESLFADDILADIELHPSLPVLKLNECGLAERPAGYHPPCYRESLTVFRYLQEFPKTFQQVGRGVLLTEIIRIGIDPCFP